MYTNLRCVTFLFFGVLFLIEFTCAMINTIILEKSVFYPKIDESTEKIITINIITSSTGIFVNFLSLIIVSVFGIHSLYFKVKFKLALYMIFSLVIILMTVAIYMIIILYRLFPKMRELQPPEIKDILSYKEFLQTIDTIKFCFYIILFIFVFILRRTIIKEEEESPLLFIDEGLNEELYKNIIKQSQHPNDKSLYLEYNRICSMSKRSISIGHSNDNTDMDKTDENINNVNVLHSV